MKLYQGFYNINNIEIIYFRAFPISSELTFLSDESKSLSEIIYDSLRNEKFYIFKIGSNYYTADSIEFNNQIVKTELFMINVPTLYIINEQLKNVVSINNITKFDIITHQTAQNIQKCLISFDQELLNQNDPNSLTVLNVLNFSEFENAITRFDLVIFNHHVSFIGINDYFKIFHETLDITNEYLQKLFIFLKTMCLLTKFYHIENVQILNNDCQEYSQLQFRSIYFENINCVNLKDLLNIFETIKTKCENVYI